MTDHTTDITAAVLEEILEERIRQDIRWGQQNHGPAEWFLILGEEIGEAARELTQALLGETEPEAVTPQIYRAREELVQAAAVAVAMIESLDRNQLA